MSEGSVDQITSLCLLSHFQPTTGAVLKLPTGDQNNTVRAPGQGGEILTALPRSAILPHGTVTPQLVPDAHNWLTITSISPLFHFLPAVFAAVFYSGRV